MPLDKPEASLNQLYANRVIMILQRNFQIPPDMNDPEIVCVVQWEIMRDGTVQNIEVLKSTGDEELDSMAVDAVRKSENVGGLPDNVRGESLKVSLPFQFGSE